MRLGEQSRSFVTEETGFHEVHERDGALELTKNYVKISASRNRTGFYVDGLIQGAHITWKVDTGAKNSFITEEMFHAIPPENRPVLEPARKKFATASGHDLRVLGTAYMTLNFDDFETEFRIFVGEVSQNLLGEDFYTMFKCNWDYNEGGIIADIADDSKCRRTNWITTCEEVTVSPGHEAVVRSLFSKTENEFGIPLALSSFLQVHGVLVARTLLDANESDIYIRLFNPGIEAVTVKCDERVALFSPILNVSNSEFREKEEVNLVTEVDSEELPEYVIPVFDEGRIHLSAEEMVKFKEFLQKRSKTFADPKGKLGQTNLGEHRIVLDDDRPFKEASRNVPLFKRDILDSEIQKLKEMGVIEKSKSPWSSQLVLVQKKDKSWRVCVDYRRLNARTIKDAYPKDR